MTKKNGDIATTVLRAPKTRVVPFERELHEGMSGRDVVAVKRALRVWRPAAIDNKTQTYGAGAVAAVKLFQRAHALPQTGVYDQHTHQLLAPYFDAYGVWLLMQWEATASAPRKRLAAAALAIYTYHQQTGRVHYTETSDRMSIVRFKLKPPFSRVLWEDCSSFVTGCFYIAGQPDPNGSGYNGSGYTGTLGRHGSVVTQPFPGDVVLYPSSKSPAWPWAHTALVIGDDVHQPATHCLSHGEEGDPVVVPIDYRRIGEFRSYV